MSTKRHNVMLIDRNGWRKYMKVVGFPEWITLPGHDYGQETIFRRKGKTSIYMQKSPV